MVEGLFAAVGKGVMGDEDRTEFSFNYTFTDTELLELLERNPRVSMMCQWMVQQALKDGIYYQQPSITIEGKNEKTNEMDVMAMATDEWLQTIHFIEKIQRAMMFARLHGSSMCLFLNSFHDLQNDTGKFTDFEVYHRLANGNGWRVKDVDVQGNPKTFIIYIMTEKMKEMLTFEVPASRVIIFKNPKIGERWDGTPSSKKIAHVAQLEELIIKYSGKFALDRANSFLHAENVPSQEAADALDTELSKIPLQNLSTGPGILITPKSFSAPGSAEDFNTITTILKKYMANAMQVSQSLMDGAAEGAGGSNTLSSSQTNTLVSYSTIKEIQEHFKPYIEQVLRKLGFFNPNIIFISPTPQVQEEKPNVDQ